MRIIAGKFKGRRLATPRGRNTRPTASKVREAVFNICGARCANAVVADLFAGTGAFGLEAVSRGADFAIFIDSARPAVDLIGKNIAVCRAQEKTCVILWDAARNLTCLKRLGKRFDIVFADPPYGSGFLSGTMKNLACAESIATGALIILEHDSHEAPIPPEGLVVVDQRRYGKTIVTFLEKTGTAP
ncbi:MAG: 16S rRNA (guanine(966)-N(2))-methyltransferase RsmD [Deltaproteobacteria bacterium]|nr:16S rRNA (guanine(966)-N(2))-methyltransferase RsmD [Deltaproteobacteria bacterium]